MIVYSKSSGYAYGAIGKLETPIKMIIQHESDLMKKQGGICQTLFNVEKSSRFAETIVGGNEFDIFRAVLEGEAAERDFTAETYHKAIEHIQYMKEFIISAEMMEDANYGVAADAKRRAQNFVRAYYKTMNRLCADILTHGHVNTLDFGGVAVDTTTADGYPLFYKNHRWGFEENSGTQSNYFYGDIAQKSGTDGARVFSTEKLEESLYTLSGKIRNMLDENGEPLGYIADTIIIPGNQPLLEAYIKKICGTPYSLGNSNNDINLNYGNWNIVVIPSWRPNDLRFMVMSSEANKNLCGNMFFNRVPLTVTNWVDNSTGNYIWTGRCRFGVGFGTYKHIVLAVDSASAVNGATALA